MILCNTFSRSVVEFLYALLVLEVCMSVQERKGKGKGKG